jgi:hypothetical protein
MGINKILEKYNLIKTFETELNVEKKVFVNEFKQMTEKGYYSPVLGIFDIFSPRSKKYVGDVTEKNLKIRENYNFENFTGINTSKVKSEFYTENNKLKVKTTIQGIEILPFILIVIIWVIYILTMLLLVVEILIPPILTDINIAYILPPLFVSFFVYLLTYLPYRIAKRNIVEMKNNIEIIYQLIEKTTYNNVSN